MKRVIPALLTDKRDELVKMLDICSEFTDYVQIDIMDGNFVPSLSVSTADLRGLRPSSMSEAHLMVQNPLEWLDVFKEFGSKKIIFHFEFGGNHNTVIEEIKKRGFEVGLAVNPPTPIKDFKPLIDKLDSVLFLSVNPGFYGSTFIPQVLGKIREFKKLYPHKLVGVDGGIKFNNFQDVASSGADDVCVGSAILKAKNPKEAYLNMLNLLKQHG